MAATGLNAGNPASRHKEAFDYAREHELPCTCHAGEGDGPEAVGRVVGMDEHGKNAGHGPGRVGVDRTHPGVGVGRAQDHAVGEAVRHHVVDVTPAAREQPGVLGARDRLAKSIACHGPSSPAAVVQGAIRARRQRIMAAGGGIGNTTASVPWPTKGAGAGTLSRPRVGQGFLIEWSTSSVAVGAAAVEEGNGRRS